MILFADDHETVYSHHGTFFRKRLPLDELSWNQEGENEYVLESEGKVVASGGFLLHYNEPFADLYMEVDSAFRGRGFAGLILQEVKKACYRANRIQAARCNVSNPASKASLLKAGFKIAGCMIKGEIVG